MVSLERINEVKESSVAEIREFLEKECGIDDPNVLSQRKGDLKAVLETIAAETVAAENTDDVFEEAEEDEGLGSEEEPIPIPEVVPEYGSDGWEDYVIRQFRDYELDKGNPRCVGCRRVVQKLIGPIISSGIVSHTPPSVANQGTGTVVYEVSIIVENESHPAYGKTELLYNSDIADVNILNTDPPFHKHQCATAATRAEGRIYRKILLLNTITAEEASEAVDSEDEWNPDTNITDGQINLIELLCRPNRCDLNVMEFVNCGKNQYASILAVPEHVAGKMIQELNSIQQGEHKRPEGVGRFDPNWRNNE